MGNRFGIGGAAQCLLAGLAPPVQRCSTHPRLGEVVSQNFGLGIGDDWKSVAQDVADVLVDQLPPALEQALVSRFLDKRMADNIRVVGINPGPVGTDRHITLLKTRAKNQLGDENRYKEFQKGMPLGRPAHAREIGDLMAFLASDRSGYTSGVIFTVDGGHTSGWS